MQKEREKIKQMVRDNKISSGEAESLLSALDQSENKAEENSVHSDADSLHLDFSSLGSTISTLVNNFMSNSSIGNKGSKYLLEREIEGGYDLEAMNIEMEIKNIGINITGHKKENIICRAELRIDTEEQSEAEEYFADALSFDGSKGLLSFSGREEIKSGNINLFIPENGKYNLFLNSKNGSLNIKQISILKSQLTTKNGSINLSDISGTQHELETKNGSIFFRGRAERIKGTTKNGSIKCIAENDQSGEIDLSSKNGSIKISVPDKISSRLDMQTRLGRISVGLDNPEYSQKTIERAEKHFIVENKVKAGPEQLNCKLETVNGSINAA